MIVWANSHHTASSPIGAEMPWLTQLSTPPVQPEASSAATSDTGTKNTSAGSTYRNTEASPTTARADADPRFPTDPTVSRASAVQLISFGPDRRAAGWTWRGGALALASVARGRLRLRTNMTAARLSD